MAQKKLPCTLISGFLGSGKTTLLKHILRNNQGLRCAVLVNDMAELNIDGSLLKSAKLIQTGEGFVEMQNGCICCTLRDDFVAELSGLARSGRFDYLVIESTGIAEPMQVAEAFAVDLVENGERGAEGRREGEPPLHELVQLDTCVTVVDAANLMDNFASLETIREKGGEGEEEEERNISDLLLDGIEFAEVILLNKVDLVSAEEARRLEALLRTLNPSADVIPTTNSAVLLDRVIATGKFSFDKAAKLPGWLKTLQGETVLQPETEEYGIGSFVYRARRPFHPQRLHDFLSAYAVLQEPDWQEGEEEEGSQQHDHAACSHSHSHPHHVHEGHYGTGSLVHQKQQHGDQQSLPALLGAGSAGQGAPAAAVSSAVAQASQAAQQAAAAVQSLAAQLALPAATQQSVAQLQANAAAMAAAAAAASAAAAAAAAASLLACQLQSSSGGGGLAAPASVPAPPPAKRQLAALGAGGFGQVLRSKGFIWLATRPDLCGEWSQAGGILQLGVGGPWYCVLPDSEWPEEEDKRAEIRADFQEPHGDRRQELVFIGIGLDRAVLSAALDACLASEAELAAAAAGGLADPFAAWPTLEELLEDNDEDEEGASDGSDLTEDLLLSDIDEEGSSEDGEGEGSDEEESEGSGGFPAPAPGRVHDVGEGAAEVQALLDATDAQLAVVSWHAPWVLPCAALTPGLDRLAAAHPRSLLVLRLDVEATAANQALALEKVMERPTSRRQGAKPVLRREEKFPCLTAHAPPSLQPAAQFTGPTALADLLTWLADNLGPEPPAAEAAAAAPPAAAKPPAASPRPAAASRPAAAAAAAANGVAASSKPAAPASLAAAPASAAAAPSAAPCGRLVVLKRGAVEAKELLVAGQAAGAPVVVVWSEPESEACQALVAAAEEAAQQSSGVVFVDTCPGVSKANALLAGALKVATFPTVHVYRGMKLGSKLEGPGEATPEALASLAAELAAEQAQEPAAAAAPAPGVPSSPAPAPAQASPAAGAAAATAVSPGAGPANGQQAQHVPSIYDPPSGKYAKPGATKRLDDGRLVHFFPKMPCLRCGCPWWTSDEWDARCIRCSWDCESGGYDDNSQPLPKYRAKWEQFTALIKEGRAAPYAKRRAPKQ